MKRERGRAVRVWLPCVLLWIAGCYSFRPVAGAPCQPQDQCPIGQACVAGTCQPNGTPAVGAGDASVGDASDGGVGSDAPPRGHDEDGDGFGDDEDNCPGLASANNDDTDGDGVGDACDPSPSTREKYLFSPFTSVDKDYGLNGDALRYVPDDVHPEAIHVGANGHQQNVARAYKFGNADFWYRVRITSRSSGTTHKITIEIAQNGTGYYYGELSDDAGSPVAAIMYYDGNAYNKQAGLDTAPLPEGELVLHLQTRLSSSSFTFEVVWSGKHYTVTKDMLSFTGGTNYSITFQNLEADIESVMVIVPK